MNLLNDVIMGIELYKRAESGGSGIVKTTYAKLKALRDTNSLAEGTTYRITDYVTTTVQPDTQSGNHSFDILVFADSTNKLNENACAVRREGDTYFPSYVKMESWELKYDLDNDINRYVWADVTNGKGVIYWMKDENNNECSYDFKNIKFKRAAGDLKTPYITTTDFYYTLSIISNNNVVDYSTFYSIASVPINVYFNKIVSCILNGRLNLNNIVFINSTVGATCSNNTFEANCSDSTFGDNCWYNTFETRCLNNTFKDYCISNIFRKNCSDNTFGNGCMYNVFGNNCFNNIFGNGCMYNVFGNNCFNNIFGDGCLGNTFMNKCSSNIFGSSLCNVFVQSDVSGQYGAEKDWTKVIELYNKSYPIEVFGYRSKDGAPTTNIWRYYNSMGMEEKGVF